jgi:ABC-type polysaccharide/polyol phosphate export permease
MNTRARPTQSNREYSDVVQVFEPHVRGLPDLREYISEVVDRRAFITELASAQIRGQQSSTVLGELWSLADPIFQAAIYYFLFAVIRGSAGGGGSSQFITVIISSVFFFNYTRIAIADGGRSVLRNKGLVLNAIFPRALLPLSEVYKGLLETLPALAIYAVLHVLFRAPISQAILLLPLLLLFQTAMNLGFAFMFSTLTVFFKDVSNLLAYILRILTFATPVVYPVATLQPNVQRLLIWNPLFPLFSAYQGIISGQAPTAGQILACLFWSVLLVSVGAWAFLRYERTFALYV